MTNKQTGFFESIVLFLVFYLIVTPVGIIMRVLKIDPLKRAFNSKKDSYWEAKN